MTAVSRPFRSARARARRWTLLTLAAIEDQLQTGCLARTYEPTYAPTAAEDEAVRDAQMHY